MPQYLMTVKHVYRRARGSNLTEALTTSWTDGDSVSIEHVVDFDPDGGIGVFEPGTASEEIFEYGGVNEQTEELTGVIRAATKYAHADGTFVQQGSTATTEMLANGYLEDEEHPVVGVRVPTELEMTLALGIRDVESMETIPIYLDDDEEIIASGATATGAPIGTPIVHRTDNDGVVIDSARDSVTIGEGGLFELTDVAGNIPPGTPGVATVFYNSTGGAGAGLYGRFGTGTVTLIKAF